jgi:hypothetical protein
MSRPSCSTYDYNNQIMQATEFELETRDVSTSRVDEREERHDREEHPGVKRVLHPLGWRSYPLHDTFQLGEGLSRASGEDGHPVLARALERSQEFPVFGDEGIGIDPGAGWDRQRGVHCLFGSYISSFRRHGTCA